MGTNRRDFMAAGASAGMAAALGPAAVLAQGAPSSSLAPIVPVLAGRSRIAGRVLDNTGRPVGRVSITRGDAVVAESRPDGAFAVDLGRPEPRVALTFTAEGYVPNTRVYDGRAPGTGTVVVVWPVAHRVKFDPTRDFNASFERSRIHIPANALTGPSGAPVAGPVELRFTLFDVTSALQRAAAPGDFSARFERGIRRLDSYGIFSGDLRDANAQLLTLRPGAGIQMAIAIPQLLLKKPPRQVGFFDFEVATGLWIQTGQFTFAPATLTYNGSVQQFNVAHNLDVPAETVCIVLHVVQAWNGSAVPNATVIAHGPGYSSQGTTNANGDVCLLVDRNASFWAEAYGQNSSSSYYSSGAFPQQNFTSPDFASTTADCGTDRCPYVGNVVVDIIVGLPGLPGRTGNHPIPANRRTTPGRRR
jgi:hypothetical protein